MSDKKEFKPPTMLKEALIMIEPLTPQASQVYSESEKASAYNRLKMFLSLVLAE